MRENAKVITTFSIVAFDPETDSLGVAVQSKFLAVGALVPYARAGVGRWRRRRWRTLPTDHGRSSCWLRVKRPVRPSSF